MNGHSCVTARVLAGLAICLAPALMASGCASSSSQSSASLLYPSVLADPPARDTAPLSATEVQQAMDNLISERNHLCAEAVATSGSRSAAASNCADTPAGGAGLKP
jgi:hypothetical protein